MKLDECVNDLIQEAESNEGLEVPEEDIDEEYYYVLDEQGHVIGTVEQK